MNTNKLKIGVKEAKTVKPCSRGLIFAHFEQALVERQKKWSSYYFVKLVRWKK